MLSGLMSEPAAPRYPPGFRPRRGLNWFIIGLLYASFYMCRYNFRWATPGMVAEFGFNKFQITSILSAWSLAYGTGQLINGLLTDRIGGKPAMLIGAAGTICINLIYGFASFVGTFTTFSLIWLMNGYLQSFGAPGMIKMNAAWFRRTERGTFAGIFGFMIQLGQFAINNLAPIILAGFTLGTLVVAQGDWRWLFRIPPLISEGLSPLNPFSPTIWSFRVTVASTSSIVRSVCCNNGSATFSPTVRDASSAPD